MVPRPGPTSLVVEKRGGGCWNVELSYRKPTSAVSVRQFREREIFERGVPREMVNQLENHPVVAPGNDESAEVAVAGCQQQ